MCRTRGEAATRENPGSLALPEQRGITDAAKAAVTRELCYSLGIGDKLATAEREKAMRAMRNRVELAAYFPFLNREGADRFRARMHDSNADAIAAVRDATTAWLESNLDERGKHRAAKSLTELEVAQIISQHVAIVMSHHEGGYEFAPDTNEDPAVYIYNYDTGNYSLSNALLLEYISATGANVKSGFLSDVQQLMCTSNCFKFRYLPLPPWKRAFHNGIYDLVSDQFEPFSPVWTVLSTVGTDYIPHAVLDSFQKDDGTSMNMATYNSEFCCGNENRIRLLEEIDLTLVTGNRPTDSMFFIYGDGGDGKSTYFSNAMASALRGQLAYGNVGNVGLKGINDDKKIQTLIGTVANIGDDNSDNLYIRNDERMKEMSNKDGAELALDFKYRWPKSVLFAMPHVQLVNSLPNFPDSSAVNRRIVLLRADGNFVFSGKSDNTLSNTLRSRRFSEHLIASCMHYQYRSDYNRADYDRFAKSRMDMAPLPEFICYLRDMGFFNHDDVTSIPLQHLEAAYQDWSDENRIGCKDLGTRSFNTAVDQYMRMFGYESNGKRERYSSAKIGKTYNPSIFGHMLDGTHLSKAIKNSGKNKALQGRFYHKVVDIDPDTVDIIREAPRADYDTDLLGYYGYNLNTVEAKLNEGIPREYRVRLEQYVDVDKFKEETDAIKAGRGWDFAREGLRPSPTGCDPNEALEITGGLARQFYDAVSRDDKRTMRRITELLDIDPDMPDTSLEERGFVTGLLDIVCIDTSNDAGVAELEARLEEVYEYLRKEAADARFLEDAEFVGLDAERIDVAAAIKARLQGMQHAKPGRRVARGNVAKFSLVDVTVDLRPSEPPLGSATYAREALDSVRDWGKSALDWARGSHVAEGDFATAFSNGLGEAVRIVANVGRVSNDAALSESVADIERAGDPEGDVMGAVRHIVELIDEFGQLY